MSSTLSTHRAEVVNVILEKHPTADSLSIVRIDGYQIVVRTADWLTPRLGVYVLPDSLVPVDRPEFAFLKDPDKPTQTHVRIKVRRLRGEYSMGLLIPAPADVKVGDDVAEAFDIRHYEPPEPNATTGGEAEKAPSTIFREITQFGQKMSVLLEIPTYHVEAFRKYGSKVLTPGEPVWVTEKI